MDITKIVLDDGRIAEKRTSIDADGNEVIEVYVEEKKPLKLEHKISRNPIVRQIEQEDISKMIADAIAEYEVVPQPPVFKAQSVVESNVAVKEKSDKTTNIILACVLVGLICCSVYLVCVF